MFLLFGIFFLTFLFHVGILFLSFVLLLFLLPFAFSHLSDAFAHELLVVTLVRFRILQERVFEELQSRPALSWILHQALGDEISKFRRPFFVDLGRLKRDNVDNLARFGLTQVWWRSVREFKSENAKTPNVNFGVIFALAFDQLRSHPTQRSNFGISAVLFLSELRRVTKISQFTGSFSIGQNVVTLDISVHNVPTVQISQTYQGLAEDEFEGVFGVEV